MAKQRKLWNRDELILAFNLYCRTPFGKIHSNNPSIIELAKHTGRTPGSVAMKMVNFANLDPDQQRRNIKGLSHISKQDILIWEEFNGNWEELAAISQLAMTKTNIHTQQEEHIHEREFVKTEITRSVKTRLVQGFFRESVLSNYDYTCAMCQIDNISLLNASHIIPWAKEKTKRANPRNGLCLCALHDRAFDRGLVSINDNGSILISSQLKYKTASVVQRSAFEMLEGKFLLSPKKFKPDKEALKYHRNTVFNA